MKETVEDAVDKIDEGIDKAADAIENTMNDAADLAENVVLVTIPELVDDAVDAGTDLVEDINDVVLENTVRHPVLALAQTASQAKANAKWKLWKKIKNEVKEVGNDLADAAVYVASEFKESYENPENLVKFVSFAQTEGIFDILEDIGEDALEIIVGEDTTEEIV